ncbi:unnamed protein product [Clonostachys rhizophaga]|uniref:Uncharacterized protein n=1 Tax=Clonostachys rhizophaga TaxID=160324 RepID=A0A9N9YGL1_9HYPO|nr:unnamed protein product [Clonostachys rhizophaga]
MSEVENAVRRATPNKAPGTDGITNSILHNKKTLDILLPGLCKLFNACLRLGYCPAHFKDTFTVVLRKPGKDDYTQPKAYRPSNQGRMERQNVRAKTLGRLVVHPYFLVSRKDLALIFAPGKRQHRQILCSGKAQEGNKSEQQ